MKKERAGVEESSPVLSQAVEKVFREVSDSAEGLHCLGGVVLHHLGRDREGMSELYQSLVLGALKLRTVVGDVRKTVKDAMPPVAGEIVLEGASTPRPLVTLSKEPVEGPESLEKPAVPPEVTLPDGVKALFAEKSVVGGIEAFRLIWEVSDPVIYLRMGKAVREAGIELERDSRGRRKYQLTKEQVLAMLGQFEKGSGKKRKTAVEAKPVSSDEPGGEFDEDDYVGQIWEV